MGFGNSTLFLKINLVLLIITVILDLLGLALPYWVSYDNIDTNWGLWQYCPWNSSCRSYSSVRGRVIYHYYLYFYHYYY